MLETKVVPPPFKKQLKSDFSHEWARDTMVTKLYAHREWLFWKTDTKDKSLYFSTLMSDLIRFVESKPENLSSLMAERHLREHKPVGLDQKIIYDSVIKLYSEIYETAHRRFVFGLSRDFYLEKL